MNKEPVAVIHYTDGTEKSYTAYSADNMLMMIKHCEKKGFVYIVNLTQLDTPIPIRSQKLVTAPLSPFEYLDKDRPVKSQHGAFREPTRIDRIHHPPNRDEVLKKYKGV